METEQNKNPKTLAQQIDELMQLPQNLCKQCGFCCTATTFKGMLSAQEIKNLIADENTPSLQKEGSSDFLTIFAPYESTEEVRKKWPELVDILNESTGKPDDKLYFFHCRFHDGEKCVIYEDRPTLCRRYPIPYKDILYFPTCGFKSLAQERWLKIEKILRSLGLEY